MMNVLILGGTRFVGRHLAQEALKQGHHVTLFNRGVSNPGLFKGVEEVHGDRFTDLHRLGDRSFDWVIDTCAYVPRAVEVACDVLGSKIGRYAFISTLSVIDIDRDGALDESHPLAGIDDPTTEAITPETYGGLKVLCEQALRSAMGDRALIVRPGLVVGPFDTTDRFTYWPWRVAKGGDILAPGPGERPILVLDGRDLAAFTLGRLQAEDSEVYNLCGPTEGATFASLMKQCEVEAERRGKGGGEVTWVDEALLLKEEVAPYSELPLWVPESMEAHNLFSASKARGVGFKTRPLQVTIADTLDWLQAEEHQLCKAGLSPEREAALLKRWRSQGA